MGRLIIGFFGVVVAYLTISCVLHYVIFPEPGVPAEVYPTVGDVWGSDVGGTEQRVLDQEGDRLYMELRVAPGAPGPPEHVHSSYDEDFHIQSGTLTLWVDGERREVGPGESLAAPRGTPHTLTNESSEVAVSRHWRTRDHVLFLSQMYGFMNEAEENRRPPRILLQASRFTTDQALAGAPVWLQRASFFLLAPTARFLGYQSYYERYVPERAR